MVKTHVKGLHMRGFKSFNQKANLEFCSGLNVLVGPNGSGKSNLIDSICFVLGRMSTKSIRAEKIQDLVHRKKGKNVGSAEVHFRLDNSSEVFPVDSKQIEIVRRITKGGKSKYYINGKRASRRQMVELISIGRIHPDGHNIIMQGDIDKFISMSPIEKRGIIEEVAGISIYEDRKKKSLSQLEKVEERLKEAKIILSEKKSYMDNLESEKKQAEQYRSYQNELRRAKATELSLRLKSINKKKNKILSKLDSLENAQNNFGKTIEERRKKINLLEEKISKIEEKIEKKGGDEQLELEQAVSDLKLAIENSNNLILSSKNEINRIHQRKKQLESNLGRISSKLSTKKKELAALKNETMKLQKKKNSLNSAADKSAKSLENLEKNLDKKIEEIDGLTKKREEIKEEIHKTVSDHKVLQYKLEEIGGKLERIIKNKKTLNKVNKSKDYYKSLVSKINGLSSEDESVLNKLQDLKSKVDKKSEIVAKLKIDSEAATEILMRNRAISRVLKSKSISGVIGTVAQLGNSQKKFQKALAVAAGSRMRNIVVKDENVAVSCLKLLKKNRSGIATFLPLSKIKSNDWSSASKKISNRKGVFGLASELISCKPKYKKIFRHVFRDTIIVKNTSTAKSLGIGKFNMVTLDGDVFSKSGAITGGYRRKGSGLKFTETNISNKLEKEKKELSSLRKELSRTEKRRNNIQEEIIELKQEKAELEGKIDSVGEIETDPSKLRKEKDNIISKMKKLESRKSELDKQESKLSDKIDKAIVEKNALSAKAKNTRFGSQSSEVKKIESKVKDIDAKIATSKAVIENSLNPEKKNIEKLISHLEKEEGEFEEQIKEETQNVNQNKKTLKKKQKEEKEFYGALKELFTLKKKYSKAVENEREKIDNLDSKLTEDSEEINALNVAKAKVEAEHKSTSEEFEEYNSEKILPNMSSTSQAKKKQNKIKSKLQSLGNVNMKALEVYDKVRKEYDTLNWRIDKLGKEQDSVVKVINQIEQKKRTSFMETFESINRNFVGIFSKVSNKMQAELVLENKKEPFEGGVTIKVRNKHNKSMYLGALSGGEKTLVALAFIFAIQEYEPAPFYLLDEIDAALDKLNSEKVANLLKEYSKKAQIIIISHNDAIISASDNIYGIWMNKKGESFVNSLKI